MTIDRLIHQRILVVEDDYFIAKQLCNQLRDRGAEPIGPACNVAAALALMGTETLGAAILDVNLNGECVYEVADILVERGIPFAFTSGYGRNLLPPRFQHVPLAIKPCGAPEVFEVVTECMRIAGH